ncbi:pseudaminic acid biosynthesis-associated methylase [Candidatus Magnetaquicoccus inordinatus]|uniref:pseudaminic acid biosynthesis-associated methylase n=1 Tax=Candidatus Magnetaquicoccus inordinatus TaxID=2496818 RepID=UPI00102C58DE|nr:pseudaminic acid biosynthesis-associated methylase [Candidatus Magnetaquicoccus inordinatus]
MNQPAPTSQIEFWRGEFGHHYIGRNDANPTILRSLVALWTRILHSMQGAPPQSILEVGCNIGKNLRALRSVTGAKLLAVEPNSEARQIVLSDRVLEAADLYDATSSALPFADGQCDLVFTNTVLIHVHPDNLEQSYREIYRVSGRYIVTIEYFSDKLESINYRGHDNMLFKRDFGGLWLDLYPNLRLLDYGFAWKRLTQLDNVTWWAFEKC